jgi:hypothetical protein
MCRQEYHLSPDDYYIWAEKVIPKKELGSLICLMYSDGIEEEWNASDKQERMIDDAKNDARHWYLSQPIERRLQRLTPESYLAHCVRLWAHGRATWPTDRLGPKPTTSQEHKNALDIIHNIKWEGLLTPALEEYRIWWIDQRNKRDPDVVKLGDEIYGEAQQLYLRLHKEKLSKNDVEQLQLYAAQVPVDWPFSDIPLPHKSMVQLDTLTEWIQQIQFAPKWFETRDTHGQLEIWDKFSQPRMDPWPQLTIPIDDPTQQIEANWYP